MYSKKVLEHFRTRRKVVGQEISVAEQGGDEEKLAKMLKEFDDILKKMQDIENAA